MCRTVGIALAMHFKSTHIKFFSALWPQQFRQWRRYLCCRRCYRITHHKSVMNNTYVVRTVDECAKVKGKRYKNKYFNHFDWSCGWCLWHIAPHSIRTVAHCTQIVLITFQWLKVWEFLDVLFVACNFLAIGHTKMSIHVRCTLIRWNCVAMVKKPYTIYSVLSTVQITPCTVYLLYSTEYIMS